MKPRTEADLQKAIIVLAKMMAIDRSLPERRVKLLKIYHIPNGVRPQGKKSGARLEMDRQMRDYVRRMGEKWHSEAAKLGAIAKAMGVRAGMPDLHLPVSSYRERIAGCWNSRFLSLYGEVKLPKVKVPDYQRVIHEELRAEGHRVDIWRSVDDAMRSFKEHLAL